MIAYGVHIRCEGCGDPMTSEVFAAEPERLRELGAALSAKVGPSHFCASCTIIRPSITQEAQRAEPS